MKVGDKVIFSKDGVRQKGIIIEIIGDTAKIEHWVGWAVSFRKLEWLKPCN